MSESPQITLTIPVDSRFIALTRVTASALAAELDFDVDEIEDLRVGANELASLLLERAESQAADLIELRYRLGTDDLEMSGSLVGASAHEESGPVDPLASQILSAVVDEFSVEAGEGRILKRRTPR